MNRDVGALGHDTQEQEESRGCLYSFYVLALLFAPFLLGATALVWFYSELDQSWAHRLTFGLLFVANLGPLFLPYMIARMFGEQRYTRDISTRVAVVLIVLWIINCFLIYEFLSDTWVLYENTMERQ